MQVFDHVRASGRAARAEITRALGISPGSATAATADLIAGGFLREVEDQPRESGRGRPPVALEVVPTRAHVIGVKLTDERLSAVLTDFAGTHLCEAHRPTPGHRKGTDEMVADIAALIERLLADSGVSLDAVGAVGLGVPGMVDHETGTVAWSPLLSERHVALRAVLESELGRPVEVDNDTNMLTLAELWFGAGRENADFAVVTIEQGVGMGLVLSSRLFRGSQGMGLELGHTKVQLDGALCRCGQRGCLEAYLADYALAREAATALDRPSRNLQSAEALLETLYLRAKAGDTGAATIFRRAGRYLALGLANVVQLFDPTLIILSGQRMRYDYLYADEVLAEMQRLILSDGRAPPRVEIHAWGDDAWARGAAALALAATTERLLTAA
ncbi:xylose operon repressor [Oceanicola granulosus HTCC2516]|uniref:Xylose operon repressor n=1 Tax=Oceanicola granulosus (strain ATCC BAA-861 / DSM 15982 / KCTC 12143 / HTCC2516) TaxID=314256 RepID=Q2CC02_OCEGH|nr:ROK family protein [Oceanicola granulosus]EAR50192.1 xylose operon repressor [Oceanicola granulosus HTCC2516]